MKEDRDLGEGTEKSEGSETNGQAMNMQSP